MDADLKDVNAFHALTEAYLQLLMMPHGALRCRQQGTLCVLRDAIAAEAGMTAQEVQDEFERIAFLRQRRAA